MAATAAAIAAAAAAYASFQQVEVSRRAARDAMWANRQAEACVAVNSTALDAERTTHMYFAALARGGSTVGQLPFDARASLLELMDAHRNYGLFLSSEQAAWAERLRHSAVASAGLIIAIDEEGVEAVGEDARNSLVSDLQSGQRGLEAACRMALSGS